MGHKHVFECLDRSLQDVQKNKNRFGGVTVLFVGDWRQILPVVRHGSREQIVDATLKHSFLWRSIKSLSLTKNMRVATLGSDSEDFAKFLESVGSGDLVVHKNKGCFKVELQQTFFVSDQSLDGLCNFFFENLDQNSSEHDWLANRAIIAPTNAAVDEVNEFMCRKFPGDAKVYKSCDSVEESAHR